VSSSRNYAILKLIGACTVSHRNKDEVCRDRLEDADVFVFGSPREQLTAAEMDDMRAWLNAGGRLLVMTTDGGDKQTGSNLNAFLKE
jgi:intraflagellar transport protein 52